MAKDFKDQYSDKEASARLIAALKGARLAEFEADEKCDSEAVQDATEQDAQMTKLEWPLKYGRLGRVLINAQIGCPLLGVKRQHLLGVGISAFGTKRTTARRHGTYGRCRSFVPITQKGSHSPPVIS